MWCDVMSGHEGINFFHLAGWGWFGLWWQSDTNLYFNQLAETWAAAGRGAGLIMIQETKIRKLPRPWLCWLEGDEQSGVVGWAEGETVQQWLINSHRALTSPPPHQHEWLSFTAREAATLSTLSPLCSVLDEGLICHVKNSKFSSKIGQRPATQWCPAHFR